MNEAFPLSEEIHANFQSELPIFVLNASRIASFESYLLQTDFLLGLYFYPEDGGKMFLRNID
jgi:hypothetical protein